MVPPDAWGYLSRVHTLFLALEEMLGYHTTCGIMVGIGVVWLGFSLFKWRKRSKAEAASGE